MGIFGNMPIWNMPIFLLFSFFFYSMPILFENSKVGQFKIWPIFHSNFKICRKKTYANCYPGTSTIKKRYRKVGIPNLNQNPNFPLLNQCSRKRINCPRECYYAHIGWFSDNKDIAVECMVQGYFIDFAYKKKIPVWSLVQQLQDTLWS